MSEVSDDVFESVDQACANLGIRRTSFYKFVNEGRLRTVKVGRYRKVRRSERLRLMAELEAETAPSAQTYAHRMMTPREAA